MKKAPLLLLLAVLFIRANAQLEFSHLSTKGYSSFGGGAMFYWGIALSRGNAWTWETGGNIYAHAALTSGYAAGYRHTFNHQGYGFYVEPQLSYAYGAANIPRRDSLEYPRLRNDGYINQPDLSGLGVFLTAGYIFTGKFGLNIGLRYEHIFTFGDPGVNVLDLRFSHTILFGRERFR